MSTPQSGRRRRKLTPEEEYLERLRDQSSGSSTPAETERYMTTVDKTGAVVRVPIGVKPAQGRSAGKGEVSAARRPGWWGSTGSLWGLGAGLTLLSVALVVLLVFAALTVFGLLGNQSVAELREARAEDEAGKSATATAERAAAAVLAYDYRSLESSRDNAVQFLDEEFAEEYTKTFDDALTPTAEQTKAVVTAEVQASSVVRASEDRVRVLLFVDQTTESTSNPTPQLALNRVEMVMVRNGDSWLVEEITSY